MDKGINKLGKTYNGSVANTSLMYSVSNINSDMQGLVLHVHTSLVS